MTLTVSPVRHLKDGFVENTVSKAHLLSAVHQLVDGENIFYFPAYELMMDELRDYRFYASDMIHPSPLAVSYIWERFLEVYAFAKAQQAAKEVQSIQQSLSHKPFNPDTPQHQRFIENLRSKIANLEEQYPHMQFEESI